MLYKARNYLKPALTNNDFYQSQYCSEEIIETETIIVY